MASIKRSIRRIKQEFGEKTYCHLGSLILKENIWVHLIFKPLSGPLILENKGSYLFIMTPVSLCLYVVMFELTVQ